MGYDAYGNYTPDTFTQPTGIMAGQSSSQRPYWTYGGSGGSSSSGGMSANDIINAAMGIYGIYSANQASNRAPKFYQVPESPEDAQKRAMQMANANMVGGYTTDFMKGINNLGTPDLSLSTNPNKPPKALWGMNMLTFPSVSGGGGGTTTTTTTGATGGNNDVKDPTSGQQAGVGTPSPVGGGGTGGGTGGQGNVGSTFGGTFPDPTTSVGGAGPTINWGNMPGLNPDQSKQLQSTMPAYDPTDPNMWEKSVNWLYETAKKYGPQAAATAVTLLTTANPAAASFAGKLANWFAGLFGWGTNPKGGTGGGTPQPGGTSGGGGATGADINQFVDWFTGAGGSGGGGYDMGPTTVDYGPITDLYKKH